MSSKTSNARTFVDEADLYGQDQGDNTSQKTSFGVAGDRDRISDLYDQVLDIGLKQKNLEDRLETLERHFQFSADVETIRETSDSDARALIIELFEKSECALVYSEIADELRLDLEQVVRVCENLVNEGTIDFDD